MSEIAIRPLTANDRAAWEPLWQGYLTFYKASLTPETSDATFARLTGGQEPMGGFIAERDGKAIGIVNYVLHRTTWSQKEICYLQDLFTSEDARGHVGNIASGAEPEPAQSTGRRAMVGSDPSFTSEGVDVGVESTGLE